MTVDPVRAEIHIAAPPERVFRFFTEPELIGEWLGSAAGLDPRPGGRFAVDMGSTAVRGHYEQLDPPHRIVFTWGVPDWPEMPAGTTRVEIALTPEDGGTRVALSHHGLADSTLRDRHSYGWTQRLAKLAAVT